jgi:hypothetical protein
VLKPWGVGVGVSIMEKLQLFELMLVTVMYGWDVEDERSTGAVTCVGY